MAATRRRRVAGAARQLSRKSTTVCGSAGNAREPLTALFTDHSPHQCRSTRSPAEATRSAPLLPPIDQWGYLPFPLQPLSPHSLSRRARDLLDGDLGAHRDLSVDPDPEPEVTTPLAPPVDTPAPGNGYNAVDAAAAWERRRRDLGDLAGIIDVLAYAERHADELNRRAAKLVEGWL